MDRRAVVSIAIAVVVLVAGLAVGLNRGSAVVYASVGRVYSLVPGYAVVFHRYGLTGSGNVCARTVNSISLSGNFTVCVRLHTDYGFSSVQAILDHGDWRIVSVPSASYRFLLNTSNGVVSVDVPGELSKPHMYCFAVIQYSNGTGAVNAYVDGNLYRSVSFTGSVPVQSRSIEFGGWNATLTLLLVYNRLLGTSIEVIPTTSGNIVQEHEEYVEVASGIIPYNGLVLYFDPTLYDYYRNVWVDFSGNGNDMAVSCSNPVLYVDRADFFVVWRRYNDYYYHFQYFPWYSRIEIYDLSMSLFGSYVIQGADNGFGQVIDYRVPTNYVGTFVIYYYDPNEGVTTTTTVTNVSTVTKTATTSIILTNMITVTTTATVTETRSVSITRSITSTATVTTTVTSFVPVVSYRTTTTTVTAPAAFRWDWLLVLSLLVIIGVAVYYIMKHS